MSRAYVMSSPWRHGKCARNAQRRAVLAVVVFALGVGCAMLLPNAMEHPHGGWTPLGNAPPKASCEPLGRCAPADTA